MLNLKFFWQIDGTYKDGMRKYFQQQKKRHAINHSNPLCGVCHICLLSLIYVEVWSGLEGLSRTSKREGKETIKTKSHWFFMLFL